MTTPDPATADDLDATVRAALARHAGGPVDAGPAALGAVAQRSARRRSRRRAVAAGLGAASLLIGGAALAARGGAGAPPTVEAGVADGSGPSDPRPGGSEAAAPAESSTTAPAATVPERRPDDPEPSTSLPATLPTPPPSTVPPTKPPTTTTTRPRTTTTTAGPTTTTTTWPFPPDGPSTDLAAAKALWDASKPARYSYYIRRTCFCAPDYVRPLHVFVDGATVRVTDGESEATVSPDVAKGLTMDELYAEASAIGPGGRIVALQIETTGPAAGRIVRIELDPIVQAIDDEIGYEVASFTVG